MFLIYTNINSKMYFSLYQIPRLCRPPSNKTSNIYKTSSTIPPINHPPSQPIRQRATHRPAHSMLRPHQTTNHRFRLWVQTRVWRQKGAGSTRVPEVTQVRLNMRILRIKDSYKIWWVLIGWFWYSIIFMLFDWQVHLIALYYMCDRQSLFYMEVNGVDYVL